MAVLRPVTPVFSFDKYLGVYISSQYKIPKPTLKLDPRPKSPPPHPSVKKIKSSEDSVIVTGVIREFFINENVLRISCETNYLNLNRVYDSYTEIDLEK